MVNKIIVMDLILVVVSLAVVGGLYSYSNSVLLSPEDSVERISLFKFEEVEFILLDDNPEFSSPERIELTNGLIRNFSQGVYYVKIERGSINEIVAFTVEDEINLKFVLDNGIYEIVNAEKERLNVEFYQGGEFKERFLLGGENA